MYPLTVYELPPHMHNPLLCLYRVPSPSALLPFPTRRSSDLRDLSFGVPGSVMSTKPLRGNRLGGWRYPRWLVPRDRGLGDRSEEHTSELQSLTNLVCRLLL